MLWKTVGNPGYLGKKRDETFAMWNEKYGANNWRLGWQIGKKIFDALAAYALYEDAYFEFLKANPMVLNLLIREASNVYDDEISNVNSHLDYRAQETPRTHLQDIAIRRSLVRLGCWFEGTELIRIRQEKGTHSLSITLSPGRVPFHRPDLILRPELTGWWDPETVESFYQTNRVLQIQE